MQWSWTAVAPELGICEVTKSGPLTEGKMGTPSPMTASKSLKLILLYSRQQSIHPSSIAFMQYRVTLNLEPVPGSTGRKVLKSSPSEGI